jgi:hypothetical protein
LGPEMVLPAPVHRHAGKQAKKGDFSADFLFDLPEPPPYNPRPRCFAAEGYEVVLPLIFKVKIANGAV